MNIRLKVSVPCWLECLDSNFTDVRAAVGAIILPVGQCYDFKINLFIFYFILVGLWL